jgi:low temperature requirement protein LtrA
LLFMVATVASIPMAGSVSGAFGIGGPACALSVSVILAMGLFVMIGGLGDEPVVRASILRYSVPNWFAIALMVGGGFMPGGWRVGAWWTAMGVVLVGTIRAGSSEWLVRPGHFAERHGLILIVALGEVIVALGLPVTNALATDTGLAAGNLVALVAAGVFAGLLWWGYFDRPLPALEHRHEAIVDGQGRGRFARDVYTYGHYPLVGGVILATAGLEAITVHPAEPVATPARLFLWSGLALYLAAIVAVVFRAFAAVAVERLVAIGALGVVIAGTGSLDGILVLVFVDVVVLVTLLVEHHRVEHRFRTVHLGARAVGS